jgi:hypothetical protein
MASDLRRAALLELVANSAAVRAARYREQAAQLKDMAHAESIGRLRDRLLDLAEQYEGLAANVQIRGAG